ncbi:GNAT family N-acetyltransferase [Acinetobacter pittii]|uniref:GNAT family N-acetyltransferase n=1 Tax=Acinetobacter pittii TaxID=48296 RepID=UPI001EE5D8C7|nr:GNAT family N-acetyltransferase [Acinetobacter pittii]
MIRPAKFSDVEKIVQLIRPYIKDFAISPVGEEKFSLAMITKLLEMQSIKYFVFEQNDCLVGVIAYKEPAHLIHFFVDQEFQNNGIGRAMWEFVENKIKLESSRMTVNSSCYAQSIYEKFGFEPMSTVVEDMGLKYIPMQKLYL